MSRSHSKLLWQSLWTLVGAVLGLFLLAFVTASTLRAAPLNQPPAQTAPLTKYSKNLNLNELLTVKARGCNLTTRTFSTAKFVIYCTPGGSQAPGPSAPAAKNSLVLGANDGVTVRSKACYLWEGPSSPHRIVVRCISIILTASAHLCADDERRGRVLGK